MIHDRQGAEKKIKAQGLYVSYLFILANLGLFSFILFSILGTKLQKQQEDVYVTYSMIDQIMSDLNYYKENIDKKI